MLLKRVNPVYDNKKKKYFCPVCNHSLHYNTTAHRNCGVQFILTPSIIQANKTKRDITSYLHPYEFQVKSIAVRVGLSVVQTSNILRGKYVMSDDMQDTIILLLEDQVTRLKTLIRNLKAERRR